MKPANYLAAILIIFSSAVAFGQKTFEEDGPVGIFQSGAEYDQFMRSAKEAAYGEGGSAELQAMIPLLNDIVLNKEVGWTANEYRTTGSTLGLLTNSDIRKEIEMVDDQYRELQELNASIQKRSAEQIRGLDFGDRDNLVAQIRKIRDEAINDLNKVLLPHQVDRLRQIRMQTLLQRRSLVDVLTSNPVKSDLEITDQQSVELKELEKVVQQDLAKQISKLQENARDRILSKLSATQQRRAKEMIGEAFEFKTQRNKKSKREPKVKVKRKGNEN